MLALSGGAILLFLKYWQQIDSRYLLNPVSLSILATLAWILITAISSQHFVFSIKYFLAKCWYVIALFAMPLHLLRNTSDYKQLFKVLFISLLFTVVIILIRHAAHGYSFEMVNKVLKPFYRNHVNYACFISASLPFFMWFRNQQSSKVWKFVLAIVFLILLFALFVTYTRAALIATFIGFVFYFVLRFKLTRLCLGIATIALLVGATFMLKNNKYLDFAPDYQRTVEHTNFDDLLAATYQLEDISTMERFYRWIAGYHMIKERPLMGFGPASFYTYYKPFTVSSFTTYVSDNPEQSGIHNYYLMLWVEQGILGLILFYILLSSALIYGEKLFHSEENKAEKELILAALTSLIVVLAVSLMNDMIETDKVGTFYFLSLAVIVRAWVRKSKNRIKQV
jgi:O-antigen ligase